MRHADLPEAERERWYRFFKVVSNSLFGKTAEANPLSLPREGQTVHVRAFAGDEIEADVERPEQPGAFSFMPIASLTTAGGRLMLSIIERLVTDDPGGRLGLRGH